MSFSLANLAILLKTLAVFLSLFHSFHTIFQNKKMSRLELTLDINNNPVQTKFHKLFYITVKILHYIKLLAA
jgi:hypothetical protein